MLPDYTANNHWLLGLAKSTLQTISQSTYSNTHVVQAHANFQESTPSLAAVSLSTKYFMTTKLMRPAS